MKKVGLLLGILTLLAVFFVGSGWGQVVQGGAELPDEPANRVSTKEEIKEFQNCRVVPELGNLWDYTFEPGKFQGLKWDRPYLVEKVMGKFPLKARWFDGGLNEVTTPEEPGRYAFYAEGKTPKGTVIRRASTVFCRPKYWLGWSERPKASLEFLPVDGVDRSVWKEHEDAIATFVGRMVLFSILRQQQGAVLMSYLHEMKATGNKPTLTDTPIIRDHDYHLALKLKILGLANKYPPLKMPQRTKANKAPVLHKGTEEEAGFKPGTVDKIRKVCQAWFVESGEPFIVLVARHGVVIIHEPFGEWTWGRLTRKSPTEMASLTKLVTGLMFAQFVDQELIGIDDPVGSYLPDFPVTGDKVITLRHCFTHTTGLSGHAEWGGLHNPWLDNVIANGLDYLKPGKVHEYNGMGYDLAGKVMEIVSGKSIFRLMRENLFDPLKLKNTTLEEDLGFSCFSTAGDFARFGQLLLNKGSYGKLKFFSPQTFEKILPRPLKEYYPEIDKDWGIGITWMRQRHPDAGKKDVPKDATVLSKNVIGHGSATSAILRVDMDNDLVITQSRRRGGKAYGKYLVKFLTAIEEGLK